MHAVATRTRPPVARGGYSMIEIAVALAIVGVLAPPVATTASRLRAELDVRRSQEDAARLFTAARWAAVRDGSATVELVADPPWGRVVSANGDTLASADLGRGGVTLRLSRGRANSRVRYGPVGLGWVASQTLRFARAGQERALVISSLGRVSRR